MSVESRRPVCSNAKITQLMPYPASNDKIAVFLRLANVSKSKLVLGIVDPKTGPSKAVANHPPSMRRIGLMPH
jgi:hypothetical protein